MSWAVTEKEHIATQDYDKIVANWIAVSSTNLQCRQGRAIKSELTHSSRQLVGISLLPARRLTIRSMSGQEINVRMRKGWHHVGEEDCDRGSNGSMKMYRGAKANRNPTVVVTGSALCSYCSPDIAWTRRSKKSSTPS